MKHFKNGKWSSGLSMHSKDVQTISCLLLNSVVKLGDCSEPFQTFGENVNLHAVISQNKYWFILSLSLYIYIHIRFCDKFQYTIFYGCFLKKHDFLLNHAVQRPKPKFPVQASGNAGIGDEAATSSAKQRLPRLRSSCGIDMGGLWDPGIPKWQLKILTGFLCHIFFYDSTSNG